jgi:hypothetical protein
VANRGNRPTKQPKSMKTTDHPKKPAPASPRWETNPSDSNAGLPTQTSSPPQPPAPSDEQLDEVNKELQLLAAETQRQA